VLCGPTLACAIIPAVPAADDSPALTRVLYTSSYYSLGTCARGALLRRSSQRFESLITVLAENDRLIPAFAKAGVAGIVVDMRSAPANNDPKFEEAMHRLRIAIGQAFARVVVLVTSASGEMQVGRLHRTDATPYRVTRDVAQAWAFAAGDS
jgi:hypothetical protein